MKTMLSVDGKKIVRISDEKASQLYSEGFRYIPKSMWKEKVRDVNTEPALNEETGKLELTKKKNNKMSRAAKRHLRKSNSAK